MLPTPKPLDPKNPTPKPLPSSDSKIGPGRGRPLRPCRPPSEAERGLGAIGDPRLLPTIWHRDGTHPRDAGTGNADDLAHRLGARFTPGAARRGFVGHAATDNTGRAHRRFGEAGRLPTIPILTESRSTTSGGR